MDTSCGIMSRLARGSKILYSRVILAGKLTKHKGKLSIIYKAFTNDHIREIDPARRMLVPTVITNEVSTAVFVVSITACILSANSGSSNYLRTSRTIVYRGG